LILYQIALSLIPNIGDITAKKLVAYCGGVDAVFKEKKKNLLKIPGVGEFFANAVVNQNVMKRAEEELTFVQKYKIATLFYLDQAYPNRLKHCYDAPVMLYYKGNADLNAPKIISIVGTRRATDYGKSECKKIVEGLIAQNVIIVSGLAYGIDSCAHKAALEFNLDTVGILAHGLDRIYPPQNKALAEKMIHHGGLLTDYMSKTIPDRENFPSRNRIIAGMSDATIVVEAGRKGGALITAEIANSYNRDVFALPGRIHDEYSEGCNRLIKTHKAALIESAADVEYIMGWEMKTHKTKKQQRELFTELTPEEETLLNVIGQNKESSIDFITVESNLPMSKVAAVLLNLEFKGIIVSLPGKLYRLN